MSMSISSGPVPPVPPVPSYSSTTLSSTSGQTPGPDYSRPPLPPRNLPSVATPQRAPYGVKPPLPPPLHTNTASPTTLQGRAPEPSSSAGSKSGGGPGTKLKQALANRRARKTNKSSGNVLEDFSDAVVSPMSPSTPSTALQAKFASPQQVSFPITSMASPERGMVESDAGGSTRRQPKVSLNPRTRIESKLHAFTAGLKKHHAIASNPPPSPIRPAPPPKPPGLRIQPSNPEIRATIVLTSPTLEDDETTLPNRKRLSSKSSDSRMSTRSTSRPLTPTMIAAQNVASAASLVPRNVASLAAKVVGADSRSSLAPVIGGSRNSFQMPNSPSISAALSYMQSMPNDEEGRDRKHRSASAALRPVPEGSPVNTAASSTTQLALVPPRKESLQQIGELRSGPRVGADRSPAKRNKRRSASLGDIFKGGFSPPLAPTTLPITEAMSSTEGLKPLNAAHAFKNRAAHQRSESAGSGSGSSYDSAMRPASKALPHNPAAAYQYVNAEVDGDQPSAWLVRPSNSRVVTPASTAAAISTAPSSIGGIIAPPLRPPRRKGPISSESGGYGSAGESSGAESFYGSKSSFIKNNIKGRLAALTGAAPLPSPQARPKALPSHPPGSYHPPPTSSSTASPPTSSTSTSASPSDQLTQSSYTRLRSNSSHVSPVSTAQPYAPIPNPKRLTTTPHNIHSPVPPSQPPPNSPPMSYAANLASTAGSFGVAAGGLAFNLGKRGWDRMGNFLGHRAGQSGTWGGYASSADGHGGRDSIETGAMSDGHAAYGRRNGTRMLGSMVRPPIRRTQGAVFGRRLEECVRETRVGSRELSPAHHEEHTRGAGLWVTALVTRCIDHIMQWGMEEEGLFRITGRSTHVNKIRSEFDNGADYILKEAHPSDLDPHSVSSVLKAYLRELPEPILTRGLAPLFDAAITLGTRNGAVTGMGFTSFGGASYSATFNEAASGFEHPTAEAMQELKNLMHRLPKENFDLLHEVSKLLRVTANNSKTTKMPLSNLLLVICPSIQLSPSFLRIVIEKQDYLFGEGDMGPVAPSVVVVAEAAPAPIPMVVPPPLPSTPRPRLQQATPIDDSKRNRTTSIFLQPGFSFTVEAYSESSNSRPLDQIPSRSVTPASLRAPETAPGTPSSAGSNSQNRFLADGNVPAQSGSVRSRHPSATKRQPSLASLFSSKPSTPIISNPIPIRPETPIEPPTLDVQVPDGSFSLGRPSMDVAAREPSPLRPADSPLTSDSEHFRLVESSTPAAHETVFPRPAVPPPQSHYSPPPQLQFFGSPPRQSGDDWATSVLMAAGGSK